MSLTSRKAPRASVVFDIDSSSVGAGIVLLGPDSPKLIWATRYTYSIDREVDYVRFVRTMLAALLEAGMKLVSEGLPLAHNQHDVVTRDITATCILGAPWFVGGTRETTITHEKSTLITRALISEHMERLGNELLADRNNKRFMEVMRGAKILESVLMNPRINGYPVEHYVNKSGASFSFSAWFSAASPEVEEQINAVLDKILPNTTLTYVTSTRVLYEVARLRLPAMSRVFLVDVGGEMTVLMSVSGRHIEQVTSIPHGGNHLLRALAGGESSDLAPAASQLSLLVKQASQPQNLPEPLRAALALWKEAARESLVRLSAGLTPPRNVVLVCDHAMEGWYQSLLAEAWVQPGLREEIGFRTLPLVPENTSAAERVPDERLYVEALGLPGILN